MGKAITYSLSMNPESFAYVTTAISVHSQELKRLQTIGQCVPQWLERWRGGTLPPIDLSGFRSIWALGSGERRVVKLNLSEEDAATLREIRDGLHTQLKCRRSAAIALAGIAYAIVTDAQKSGHLRLLPNH